MPRMLGGFRTLVTGAIVLVAAATAVATFLATSPTSGEPAAVGTDFDRVIVTLEQWGANSSSFPDELLAELETQTGLRLVVALADSDTVIADSRSELVASPAPAQPPNGFVDPLRPNYFPDETLGFPVDVARQAGDAPASPVRVWVNPNRKPTLGTTIGLSALAAIVGAIAVAAAALSAAVLRPLHDAIKTADGLASGKAGHTPLRSPIREIDDLNNSLRDLDRRLDDAGTRRRAIVDELAHEIRTPLTSAMGHLRGVSEGYFEADAELIAGTISDLELLDRLVADLRTITRAENHMLKLDRSTIRVVDVVEQAAAAEAGDADIRINVGDTTALADPTRTVQILRELIRNALRYGPQMGPIDVSVTQSMSAVAVHVRDQGPGIGTDPERIFERFYRADASRTTADHGTGLGLAIVRALARAQGGDITVHNHDGGAVFTLLLKAEPEKSKTTSAQKP